MKMYGTICVGVSYSSDNHIWSNNESCCHVK